MHNILIVAGAPDSNRLKVINNRGTVETVQISIMGCNTLATLLNPETFRHRKIILGGVDPVMPRPAPADLAINTICDADTNTQSLRLAETLFASLDTPVINPPQAVLHTTRDAIYERLHRIEGLRIPKAVTVTPKRIAELPGLIEAQQITYPFIFREAGSHGGKEMLLISRPEELGQLERFAFDGRTFYMIEFVDFRSRDNRYRKARIFVIDGEPYIRHLIISDHWKINAQSRVNLMRDSAELRQEEQAFVYAPSAQLKKVCRSMYAKLQLDFFGMDCHIAEDGTLLLFEVNACMRTQFSPERDPRYVKYEYLRPNAEAIQAAFNKMLTSRIETHRSDA